MLVVYLDYNLLFRCFIGLSMDDPLWNYSTYSKNCVRIPSTDIAVLFLQQIARQLEEEGLLLEEHVTIDGRLVEAWALLKCSPPKVE